MSRTIDSVTHDGVTCPCVRGAAGLVSLPPLLICYPQLPYGESLLPGVDPIDGAMLHDRIARSGFAMLELPTGARVYQCIGGRWELLHVQG